MEDVSQSGIHSEVVGDQPGHPEGGTAGVPGMASSSSQVKGSTGMVATIGSILNILIAIPKIAGIVELLCSAVVSWYVSRQTSANLAAIADAAAFAARAENENDRILAAEKWRDTLSRARISN